jgi:predicted TIM-barrel fold metal-dependent hydrolase
VWTPELIDALASRSSLPLVDVDHGRIMLHARGEKPYMIDMEGNADRARQDLNRRDGVDRVVVALSSPIGIESLPRHEATGLIDAHLRGVEALSDEFVAWGPVALDELDPGDVDAVLERGCVGICLPATALAGPRRLQALGSALERVARAGVPLFIHPGQRLGPGGPEAPLDEPVWWQPLTSYVAQMHAAWLTFAAAGRRDHPDLIVVFSMLAGCAPLQAERFAQRGGGELPLDDPLIFYDTSGYGSRAVETMARLVGPWQLVYGSDRPVAEPALTGRERLLQNQAAELLASSALSAPRPGRA